MRVARLLKIVMIALAFGSAVPLHAAVTSRELNHVGLTPRLNGTLPLDVPLQDEAGATKPLRDWLNAKPSIWIFADYTCETLCGPIISIVSDALAHSGLRPGIDFRLIVVGFDPKDTAADAAAIKQAQVSTAQGLFAATYVLRSDAHTIAGLTDAFGFRSAYDRDRDQFAHPVLTFAVTPEGRLAGALSDLAIDPTTIRLAVLSAGRGRIGTWTDHIRLLCYGYDPASGTYTVAVGRLLAAAAAATIAALVLLIGILLQREHLARRRRSADSFGPRPRMPTTS